MALSRPGLSPLSVGMNETSTLHVPLGPSVRPLHSSTIPMNAGNPVSESDSPDVLPPPALRSTNCLSAMLRVAGNA